VQADWKRQVLDVSSVRRTPIVRESDSNVHTKENGEREESSHLSDREHKHPKKNMEMKAVNPKYGFVRCSKANKRLDPKTAVKVAMCLIESVT